MEHMKKSFQVGISSAALYGRYETEEAIALYEEWGVPCSEAFLQCEDEYGAAFGGTIKKLAPNVRVVSIHTLSNTFEQGLFSKSRRMREYSLGAFCRALDAGAACCASMLVFHGPGAIGRKPEPPNYDMLAEFVGPLSEAACERGMRVAWETVKWASFCFPEFAKEIIKVLPETVFTLDIKQVYRAGYPLSEYISAMGPRLRHVHVNDMRENGELVLPGRGIFDFCGFADSLRDVGYDGAVLIEPYREQFKNVDELRECWKWLTREMSI